MPLPPITARSRVLVVDDTADIRLLASYILEAAGHEVLLASDGADGLELARKERPDLILLDVMMPGMDGYEVCTRLKADETTRAIPVIFLSALSETDAQTRGFEVGAADFVTKPIGMAVLQARVNAHLALYAQRRSLEGMFSDAMEFAPDAIILSDRAGRIVQANARAEELFGYARGELPGRATETLMPLAAREGHHQRRMAIFEQPRGSRLVSLARCLRKDGSEFDAESSVGTLQSIQGAQLISVVRDVTERMQQQEKLREAARYARSLIETSADPLVVIDLRGKVQDANEAACAITGVARAQLVGSDALGYFTEPQRLVEGFKQVMAEGRALDYELTIRHASGRNYDVLCNATAFRNEQGEVVGLFATAHDVTESRRIQQEISTSRQRLRELAAQGEAMREYERKNIAREVHDELGQVLTALRMDLTFLDLRYGAQAPELKQKFLEMRGLIDRAIQGVRNVASNLRPTALDMGLIAAIQWVCGEFQRNTGVACEFDAGAFDGELPEDRAVALFRIVQESLTNVTRYAQATQVRVSLLREGDKLVLQVRDNGQGFDPAHGTGRKSFGLLGMQERALALGGQFELRSAPGQGTDVRVNVPLYHPSSWQETT